MDWTKVFYWLTVADNAKTFFGWFAIIFILVFIIVTLVRIFSYIPGEDTPSLYTAGGSRHKDFLNRCNKWTWYSTPFMLLFLTLWIFTPNKKDALLIIAGGQTLNFMTNDSIAKTLPKDMVNFVSIELRQMAKDAKVDLGVADSKQKILDRAKEMTADELIKQMQIDSTFSNVILNKN
jgi:hypothetical protein